jgi:hypothetical protein
MPARLAGAALALVCVAAPAHAASHLPQTHPPAMAMMSTDDVLRAVRCAIPIQCRAVKPRSKQPRK